MNNNEKSNSNVHPIFQNILDTIDPSRKPFNALKEEDKAELNKRDKDMENLSVIARESHLRNRLSMMYDFLQLSPENISTYELGFISGSMYQLQKEIDELKKDHEECVTLNRQDGLQNEFHEGIIN